MYISLVTLVFVLIPFPGAEEPAAKRLKTEEAEAEPGEPGDEVLGVDGHRASPIVEVTRLLAWLVSRRWARHDTFLPCTTSEPSEYACKIGNR